MCCEDEVAEFPAAVAAMLARARTRLSTPQTWGADSWGSAVAERPLHYAGDATLEALWAEFSDQRGLTAQDVAAALVGAVDLDTVPGLVRLALVDDGVRWTVRGTGAVPTGTVVDVPVLVSSSASSPVRVSIGADTVVLDSGEHALLEARADGDSVKVQAEIDGRASSSPDVVHRVASGVLRLTVSAAARWSVTSSDGRAWFPSAALRKWDVHGRGYFHASDVEVVVPPGKYTVRAVRGIEFRAFERDVDVDAGSTVDVEAELEPRFEPHATGWWSADLHVHANYGGEYAVSAYDAMEMQRGEGLDFMNLVAANQLTDHVHDIDLFRAALDHQLPGSHDMPAHAGLEYRNDLFGHMHVTGARADLGRYQTGHAQGATTVDWPFNDRAAAAYRDVGATVGYCHPVFPEWGGSSPNVLERVMGRTDPRTSEARCAILDAALGVVDSVDVLSNADDAASAELYRRMVGAGLRVAATAGSDAMLSLRHLGVHSNPPGWVRAYVRTGDGVSLDAVQDAIRAGRTMATNGPWVELDVDGSQPGDDLDVAPSTTHTATVRVITDGPCTVRLFRGSRLEHEWQVESGEASSGSTMRTTIAVDEPDAICAEVVGHADPLVLDDVAYAHTSPVHLRVGGRPVRRQEDVDWCLLWLDRLREFVSRHGRGVDEHLPELDARIAQARARLQRPDEPLE
jgi:hypothetical protein